MVVQTVGGRNNASEKSKFDVTIASDFCNPPLPLQLNVVAPGSVSWKLDAELALFLPHPGGVPQKTITAHHAQLA